MDSRPSDARTSGTVRAPDGGRATGARRQDIQALRALAVVAVFLFHLWPDRFTGGFVGVDIFFVVSGYLVGGPLIEEAITRGRIGWLGFYARRIRRIVPAATLAAVTSLAVASWVSSPLSLALTGPPLTQATISRDGLAAALSSVNLLRLAQDSGYGIVDIDSPLTHFWSLGVEEQFYLFAPAIALGLVLAARRRRREVLLATAALLIWGYGYSMLVPYWLGLDSYFDPLARAWEIGVGVAVAQVAPRAGRVAIRDMLRRRTLVLCWTGLLAAVLVISDTAAWPRVTTLLPVALASIILLLGGETGPGPIQRSRAVQWIGDRSFSIYLWHWPVIVFLPDEIAGSVLLVHGMAIAVTLVLAELSFSLVERPFRVARSFHGPRASIIILAASVLLVSATAAIVGTAADSRLIATGAIAPNYEPKTLESSPQLATSIVPVNIRPTLADLRYDRPRIYADKCDATPLLGQTQVIPCSYGTGVQSIVLFGDSHAAQWFDALAPGTEQVAVTLTTLVASGCPPIAVDYDPNSPRCDEWRRSAVAHISESSPDLVVVSMRTTYEGIGQDHLDSLAREQVPELLKELKVPVLWIADTPIFATDPALCVSVAATLRDCDGPVADVLPHDQNESLQRAVEMAGGDWLDLTPFVCDRQICPVVLGNTIVYRDDDHVTSSFSRELGEVFRSAVLAVGSK